MFINITILRTRKRALELVDIRGFRVSAMATSVRFDAVTHRFPYESARRML